MDTLNLVGMLASAGAIGAYLTLDYTASKSTRDFVESINKNPDVLKFDRKQGQIFQNEVDQMIPVVGPLSYLAKRYYRDIVRQD